MKRFSRAVLCGFYGLVAAAAAGATPPPAWANAEDKIAKFRQLGAELPTPNRYRNADGAPGPDYWQQKADYKINVALDEKKRRITASQTVTYTNNSPSSLDYLWVSLDQNRFRDDSTARMSETSSGDSVSLGAMKRHQEYKTLEYGFEIASVKAANGRDLEYTVSDTMMRIDLPRPLQPRQRTAFSIDWSFNIVPEKFVGARSGYEHFPKTDTYLYFLAQWFPRMAAYTDYTGWQNKQFLGRGEFTLEFGDYDVEITVPADHIVSSTGELQNPDNVLTAAQRRRLARARTAEKPVFIVTPDEAKENEKEGTNATNTWHFTAKNVRDFAWASSRKFIWDAMGHRQTDRANPFVMAMSFYPVEAEPIWSKYSTEAVVHTMDVYSRFSFPYPYPTAQSVNTWERGGMEYPMITFNGYRPKDHEMTGQRVYSRRVKYGLIGVIIHEIGHTYFPMTVNSDERRWTWMDEGFNTFLQYMAQLEWEEKFPLFGGQANVLDMITEYMVSENQVPVMTQSDSILQFGANAYVKPTAAFTVLRETVMGRKLFDHAFRTYANRWKFKRPTPADFFRTMEDASAVDLDWFWRGWFFTTDHVDVAITDVREYRVSTKDPDIEFPLDRERAAEERPAPPTVERNREEGRKPRRQRVDGLDDFYNENDEFTVSNADRNRYQAYRKGLEEWERRTLDRAIEDGEYLYFVDFKNEGGLLTPLPLEVSFEDGSSLEMMIPAEIWRYDGKAVSKLLIFDKRVTSIELDKRHQTADADFSDNVFPPRIRRSRLELFKSQSEERNLMADMLAELRSETDKTEPDTSRHALPLAPAGDPDVKPAGWDDKEGRQP